MASKVIIRDKQGTNFIKDAIIQAKNISFQDTKNLAEETEKVIKETINRKAKNPTGNLASKFYAHPIPNGHAVGDVQELDQEAPYWNHVDKGSEAIGANWQHWLPKGKWVNGLWVEDPDGFFFKPSKPIPPMNYIAETLQQMEVLTPIILRRT